MTSTENKITFDRDGSKIIVTGHPRFETIFCSLEFGPGITGFSIIIANALQFLAICSMENTRDDQIAEIKRTLRKYGYEYFKKHGFDEWPITFIEEILDSL